MSEEWSEHWAEELGDKDLERALEKLKKLKGEKKRLVIKAVKNYIDAMVGDVDGRKRVRG